MSETRNHRELMGLRKRERERYEMDRGRKKNRREACNGGGGNGILSRREQLMTGGEKGREA